MITYTVTTTAALTGRGRNDRASNGYDNAADAWAAFQAAVADATDSAVTLRRRDGQWSQTLATAEVSAALRYDLSAGDGDA